jgi:mannitol-1-/sugar-/sorbitol-6-/2-deoxyglucose-6-phosphatase
MRDGRGPCGPLRAAVFDMDGLLIDSEPLWRAAERNVFATVGLDLSDRDCTQTMGLRIDEAVEFWFVRSPWQGASRADVAGRIVRSVIDRIGACGTALPGVHHALALCRREGLRLALASSSAPDIIDAVLDRLGLRSWFEVVRSAVTETKGKPLPDVYLSACAQLRLSAVDCVAFEDSVNGLRAARAAGMRCIAVGEPARCDDSTVRALADVVLPSLAALSEEHLTAMRPLACGSR